MEIYCECGKPFYIQKIINMIKPKFHKRQTAVYCDCQKCYLFKVKKYFTEFDFRIMEKYNGRNIKPFKIDINENSLKFVCGCGFLPSIENDIFIKQNIKINILCNCKSLFTLDVIKFENIVELECYLKKKIIRLPKPSIKILTGKE